jgi:hypothetical protein
MQYAPLSGLNELTNQGSVQDRHLSRFILSVRFMIAFSHLFASIQFVPNHIASAKDPPEGQGYIGTRGEGASPTLGAGRFQDG